MTAREPKSKPRRQTEPKPTGRPSDFTQETADLICDEIAKGRSLRTICADEGAEFDRLPHERTVYRWLEEHELFRQQYARAREAQADGEFDEARAISQNATAENVQVARLQIDTIKWRAGKLAPKKYGEKIAVEHGGEIGVRHEVGEGEAAAKLAALLEAARRRRDGEDETA